MMRSGIPIGRIAGIPVSIHFLLVILWLFQLDQALDSPVNRTGHLLAWLAHAGGLFGSILLHEFGHAFAARRCGGYTDRIILWPLGGLAYCHAPPGWKPQLQVAAGGPLVTLVLAVGAFLGAQVWGRVHDPSWGLWAGTLETLLLGLVFWNKVLLVFNLLPLYPLDGGRIFLNGVWGWLETRRSPSARAGAVAATVWVTRGTAVLGLVASIYLKEIFLVVIFAWAWLGVQNLRR